MTKQNLLTKNYLIKYKCYKCNHVWNEVYSCVCDSECLKCEAKNVTSISYKELKEYNE